MIAIRTSLSPLRWPTVTITPDVPSWLRVVVVATPRGLAFTIADGVALTALTPEAATLLARMLRAAVAAGDVLKAGGMLEDAKAAALATLPDAQAVS